MKTIKMNKNIYPRAQLEQLEKEKDNTLSMIVDKNIQIQKKWS